MTSVMTSPEAFPAWPLCISPALLPVLVLTCTEFQAALMLVPPAFPPACPVFLPLYLCPYQPQGLEGPCSCFTLIIDLTSFKQRMERPSVTISAAAHGLRVLSHGCFMSPLALRSGS